MIQALLFIAFLIAPTIDDWNKKYTRNNITVYTREESGTKFVTAKAVSTFNTSQQNLEQLLLNPDVYSSLINNCESSKLIESTDQQNFVAYLTFDSPFPFKDRDVYIRFSTERRNEDLIINLNDDKSYPKKDDYVRMDRLYGQWVINNAGSGTPVAFTFMMDPGGNVSAWMVNRKADKVVYNILLNIQNRL
ncbi:SRPBCC family protein [Telluribacter humicola]|uniref:hypothetical protein n=1 Tax=Telluribacter humicola TaxID=1720261 RepID=UPI001A96087A|nr:hypothetical protein [Telluribacter humicola]